MRFVNLQTTSERVGKGQVRQLILRRPIDSQSAASPALAFGDADTGLFQSADDVLEFATAGVSRFKIISDGTVAVAGNLVVSGTTTTVNSTTLTVDDKNIELGSVATPSDTTADGGGITLKGATDKTFNWVDSTDAWTSSEHINLASGKTFQLNGAAITSSAAELNLLDNVSGLVQADLTKLAAVNSSAAELNLLNAVSGLVQADFTKLAAITSDATELNLLDGVTATTAELNILDGVTSDATELNILDGVTATTAELNYTDGVTSAIQTQLAARLPLTGGAMTGAITTNSTFDGVDIATRDAVLTSTTTTAGAALPKAGGPMTGAITNFTSTGIDDNADALAITIDSSERVGIGETSPTAKLHVVGHSTLKGFIKFEASSDGAHTGYIGDGVNMGGGGGTNDLTLRSADAMYFLHSNGTLGAWMDTSGNYSVVGDVTSSASDERLKENKVPITSAIKKITQLKGITYDWVDNINEVVGAEWNPDKKRAGLIAQDVQKVFPEVISLAPFDRGPEGKSRSGKDYLTVDYALMVPLLVEAIKEQQKQIDKLKSELKGHDHGI